MQEASVQNPACGFEWRRRGAFPALRPGARCHAWSARGARAQVKRITPTTPRNAIAVPRAVRQP